MEVHPKGAKPLSIFPDREAPPIEAQAGHKLVSGTHGADQDASKGSSEEPGMPAVKKLPPWFKEVSQDGGEVCISISVCLSSDHL